LSLGPFIAFYNFEFNPLTFAKGSKTLSFDRREVDEYVFFSTVAGDKAIAFFAIEPLDNAKFSFCHAWKPPFENIPTLPANVRSKQEQNDYFLLNFR
jgi:hypothetical protein